MWADGAQEGVYIYHSPHRVPDEEERTLIKGMILSASKRNFGDALKFLGKLCESCRAASAFEDVMDIMTGDDTIDPGNLFDFAVRTVTGSENAEHVKYGMLILALFDTEASPQMKQLIRTIGLSDEFALYAGMVMHTLSLIHI